MGCSGGEAKTRINTWKIVILPEVYLYSNMGERGVSYIGIALGKMGNFVIDLEIELVRGYRQSDMGWKSDVTAGQAIKEGFTPRRNS